MRHHSHCPPAAAAAAFFLFMHRLLRRAFPWLPFVLLPFLVLVSPRPIWISEIAAACVVGEREIDAALGLYRMSCGAAEKKKAPKDAVWPSLTQYEILQYLEISEEEDLEDGPQRVVQAEVRLPGVQGVKGCGKAHADHAENDEEDAEAECSGQGQDGYLAAPALA